MSGPEGPTVEDLEGVGFHPYQARVLLALLIDPGPADSVTLAERSGVPRTSVYAAVDRLVDLGVAHPVATVKQARWEAHSWGEVLDRVDAVAAGRLDEQLSRTARLRRLAGPARAAAS